MIVCHDLDDDQESRDPAVLDGPDCPLRAGTLVATAGVAGVWTFFRVDFIAHLIAHLIDSGRAREEEYVFPGKTKGVRESAGQRRESGQVLPVLAQTARGNGSIVPSF